MESKGLNPDAKEFVPKTEPSSAKAWLEDGLTALYSEHLGAKMALQALQIAHGTVPSKGSELHSTGGCKPCAWFWKRSGCVQDSDCFYCHLCPAFAVKARKQTKKAMIRAGLFHPEVQEQGRMSL